MDRLLIYGSYGYTGDLIARRAVDAGIDPILAGRSDDELRAQAGALDCSYRPFDLADAAANIEDVDAVLHCAGPFVHTFEPMVTACLETGTHYLDITGEIGVFEALKTYDQRAREAHVMVLPGVGFDVVPTDCLANHLHGRLPGATALTIAFTGIPTLSAGSARTLLEYIERNVVVRRDGRIVPVDPAGEVRHIDFGDGQGPRLARPFSWGDISTAYSSTGIRNISVYVPTTRRALAVIAVSSVLSPVLGTQPVKSALRRLSDRVFSGPTERELTAGETIIRGMVVDGEQTASAELRTAETYRYTALAAVEIAERVLGDDVVPGYQTPAAAYGPELVTEIDGDEFVDIPGIEA